MEKVVKKQVIFSFCIIYFIFFHFNPILAQKKDNNKENKESNKNDNTTKINRNANEKKQNPNEISPQELAEIKKELKFYKKNIELYDQAKKKNQIIKKELQKKDSLLRLIAREEKNKTVQLEDDFDKVAFLLEKKIKIIDSLETEITKTNYFLKHHQTHIVFQIQMATSDKILNQHWLSPDFLARKEGNKRVYFFGNFSSYWEAKRLADFMRKGGFDGYVTAWEGANRVPVPARSMD